MIPIGNRIIKLKEKISQGRINDIVEDRNGLIWIGTLDGLNSFDGYNVNEYRHNNIDTNSISNNIINALTLDLDGNIWLATNNGLCKLNPESKRFTSYFEKNNKLARSNANKINKLIADKDGFIWMATGGAGVVRYNVLANTRKYITLDLDSGNIFKQDIRSMDFDEYGNLWFGDYDGNIGRISSDISTIEWFNINGRRNNFFDSYRVKNIYKDVNNKVWYNVSGCYEGFYYFNETLNKIVEDTILNNKLIKQGLMSSLRSVSNISNDKEGNFWFSSNFLGVFKVEKDSTIKCLTEKPIKYLSDAVKETEVGASVMYWSSSGILWLGTNGYGLEYVPDFNFFFNSIKNDGQYENYKIQSVRAFEEDDDCIWISGYYSLVSYEKKSGLFSNYLNGGSYYSLCNNPLNNNELFLGTEGGGLFIFDKKTKSIKNGNLSSKANREIEDGINILELMAQGDSILWVGRNKGLEKYNFKTKEINWVKIGSTFDNTNIVSVISSFVDSKNQTWFGTLVNGIWQYDILKNCINQKYLKLEDNISQPQRVNCILEDSRGVIWLSTDNGVLTSSDWDTEFSLLTIEDGLSNDFVYASLEDDNGDIWFSTNKGLSKFDVSNNVFTTYFASSGLQDNEFNTGAYFKSKNGSLYFGGINGYTYFNPDENQVESDNYPLILVSASTNQGLLQIEKNDVDEVGLSLNEGTTFLNIEFSLLSFQDEKLNTYQYRNLQADSVWIDLQSSNKIIIDNPNIGEHKLEIRGAVVGRNWSKNNLNIRVIQKPFYWQTLYFKVLMVVVLLLLIIVFVKLKLRKGRIQEKKLSVLVKEKTNELLVANEKLQESNATKDKLFSIIAHDIKSPLSSLIGFSSLLESYEEYGDIERKDFISIINLSSRNLNNLIDNLLNWSRIQLRKIEPNLNYFPIREVIDLNLGYLNGNIHQKSLNIVCKNLDDVNVYADKDMISVIVRNLISNAIKFTNENGSIEISLKKDSDFYKLCITDSGVGMDKEIISNLFDDKNNTSSRGTNNEVGTGLGLILCRDFAKLNKGKIDVISKPNEGSCFCLYLKINK